MIYKLPHGSLCIEEGQEITVSEFKKQKYSGHFIRENWKQFFVPDWKLKKFGSELRHGNFLSFL